MLYPWVITKKLIWSTPEFKFCVHTCPNERHRGGDKPEVDSVELNKASVKATLVAPSTEPCWPTFLLIYTFIKDRALKCTYKSWHNYWSTIISLGQPKAIFKIYWDFMISYLCLNMLENSILYSGFSVCHKTIKPWKLELMATNQTI